MCSQEINIENSSRINNQQRWERCAMIINNFKKIKREIRNEGK